MPVKITATKGRPKKETPESRAERMERVEAHFETARVDDLLTAMRQLDDKASDTRKLLEDVRTDVRNQRMRDIVLKDLDVEMRYMEQRLGYAIVEVSKYWHQLVAKEEGGEE